jgi:hypothetical protein
MKAKRGMNKQKDPAPVSLGRCAGILTTVGIARKAVQARGLKPKARKGKL